MTVATPLVTAADESFRHQAVAPAAETAYVDAAWAERCWHLVNLGGGWVLGAGRATWPHGGRRTAVAGLNTGRIQFARRAEASFALGDDPDRPDVGPIRIEPVVPLRQVRLLLDEPGLDFGFDLTFEARFAPVPTGRNRIERHGEVVTDYMNFFQSGLYSGRRARRGRGAAVPGARRLSRPRLGTPQARGGRTSRHARLLRVRTAAGGYLPAPLRERCRRADADERLGDGGERSRRPVRAVSHSLRLDGRHLLGGSVTAELASGDTRELAFEAEGRMWMEALGYTAVPGRSAPGADRLDVADEDVREAYDGLYDNACAFVVDGVEGHGYVEVGLGAHVRYLPRG